MQILPINNQNSFKAVNKKYYDWALRESKGVKRYGEILEQLRFDVAWGDIHPQDGIDTVNAIIKLNGKTDEFFEHVLENFRIMLKDLRS
jgi:hypothetical protein